MKTIRFTCDGPNSEEQHERTLVDVPCGDEPTPVPTCQVCGLTMFRNPDAVPEPVITCEMLNDNVLGRPVYHVPPDRTIKLTGYKDPFPLNEVIAVGPGAMMPHSTERYPMSVKVGDLVAVSRVDATQMLNGEVVCFFCESSIRCIVHGEDRSRLTFGVDEKKVAETEEDAKLAAEASRLISAGQPLPQGRAFPPHVAKGRRH